MQDAVASKDRELGDMRAAVESAKETILQQNQHVGSQDDALRKAKQQAAEAQEDFRTQLHSLQEENRTLKGLVDRYVAFPLLTHI
jgi:predicted  nucleic acid-binding Zn-ribbon protein